MFLISSIINYNKNALGGMPSAICSFYRPINLRLKLKVPTSNLDNLML